MRIPLALSFHYIHHMFSCCFNNSLVPSTQWRRKSTLIVSPVCPCALIMQVNTWCLCFFPLGSTPKWKAEVGSKIAWRRNWESSSVMSLSVCFYIQAFVALGVWEISDCNHFLCDEIHLWWVLFIQEWAHLARILWKGGNGNTHRLCACHWCYSLSHLTLSTS